VRALGACPPPPTPQTPIPQSPIKKYYIII